MKPLAYRMRPTSFLEIVGQEHLVGPDGAIFKMIEKKKLYSMILYGPPGVGKTTIANVIAKEFEFNHCFFSAATDTKQKLKDIVDGAKYQNTVLIVDEIHRMKADIQDYLLPCLEDGSITMIGLTTVNPYHSVNIAIRSRCLLFELNPLSDDDIKKIILRALKSSEIDIDLTLDDEVINYIVSCSNGEVRTALNMLEILTLSASDGERIFLNKAKGLLLKPSKSLDKDSDNYYHVISALQKSIRGSDVNAALHYLARLLAADDFEIIARRLLAIAYEDIGLGNPQIGPRTIAAIQAFRELGMPEGRIPLSVLVVDMALSPKSNSAIVALDSAIEHYQNNKCGSIPRHLNNTDLKTGKAEYKYPHDYPGDFIPQQYLPDEIKDVEYYVPKETSSYERALKERYEIIKKLNKEKK